MEVKDENLGSNLRVMLDLLCQSDFVSMDFEMSGAPERKQSSNYPPLQIRYNENVIAAKKYAIVQVGITIVIKDEDNGCYRAYPFNMHLRPSMDEQLEMDREITFQARASSYILKNNFDMQALFKTGVPYMTPEEIRKAKDLGLARMMKGGIAHARLEPHETGLHDFVAKVRKHINEWLANENGGPDTDIAHQAYLLTRSKSAGLSPLEKRLTHQLVRMEYPHLTSVPMGGSIRVLFYNEEVEQYAKDKAAMALDQRIQRQIGISWFVEALMGSGKLEQADPVELLHWEAQKPTWVKVTTAKADFAELCAKLREKRHVLVGHNSFMDLVFFYHTFVGELPDDVREFADAIYGLFPRVVDTKFLATHANFRRKKSSLVDVDQEYQNQALPVLTITDPAFDSYKGVPRAHEAGYDSYITARSFVKMAAYLAAEAAKKATLPQSSDSSSESGHRTPNYAYSHHVHHTEDADPKLPPPIPPRNPARLMTSTTGGVTSQGIVITAETRLDIGGLGIHRHGGVAERAKVATVAAGLGSGGGIAKFMPDWSDPFWDTYGNRLRVYGTTQGEMPIGEVAKKMERADWERARARGKGKGN